MPLELVLSTAALVVAIIAVVIGVLVNKRLRSLNERSVAAAEEAAVAAAAVEREPGPPAFVVNPSKLDVEPFRKKVEAIAAERGLPAPLWFETTVEDPGTGQAKEALARGASVVVAVGGDGTVRSVAAALENTGIPMGLVPKGTGNLFARNLDLPLASTAKLVEIALTAPDHAADIGWVHPAGPGAGLPTSTPFLVISGVGFDAAMVADADEEMKSKMGWLAYFFAGARHLHGKKVRVQLKIDDEPAILRKVRSMLVANVGRLPGGFVLFPEADSDTGHLDIASIDTDKSLLGWTSLLSTVVLQGVGMRKKTERPTSNLEFWRGTSVRIDVDQPSNLQVDGDLIGPITSATFTVHPGALRVRYEAEK